MPCSKVEGIHFFFKERIGGVSVRVFPDIQEHSLLKWPTGVLTVAHIMAPRDTSIACLTFMRSSTFGVGLFLQSPWMLSWGKLVCENIQQTLLCPTPELYYLSAPRSLLDAETPVNRFIIHIQIWISLLHWCKRRTVKTTPSW